MSKIPLLGNVDFQSALSEVVPNLTSLMQKHLYASCRSHSEFTICESVGNGKYGRVFKVQDNKDNKIKVLKKIEFRRFSFIPKDVQSEIDMLRDLKHENIVLLYEVVGGPTIDEIYLLMEFCDNTLAQIMENLDIPFIQAETKCILLQLFKALAYIHENNIVHRDINPTNILLKDFSVVKLCDFNSAEEANVVPLPPDVGNLWYRAPELLLGSDKCTTAIDVWSSGCIFAEMLTLRAVFPGRNKLHQMTLIIDMLGTPTEESMPGYTNLSLSKKVALKSQPFSYLRKNYKDLLKPSGVEILEAMLRFSHVTRISANECVEDTYFGDEPAVCSKEDLKYGIIDKTNAAFAARG